MISSWLLNSADEYAERVAVRDELKSLTYEELLDASLRTATALRKLGVQPGDKVALAMPRTCGNIVALNACWLLGANPISLDDRLSEKEISDRSQGALLLREPLETIGLERFKTPLLTRDEDDIATILFTSGSSGKAKRVELTFGNWSVSTEACRRRFEVTIDDNWLCALPLSHVSGLGIAIRSVIIGSAVTLHRRFDALKTIEAIASDEITAISLVPTMLQRLLEAGLDDRGALRFLLVGGAPVSDRLIDLAQDRGLPICITYGKTEVCAQATVSTPDDPRAVRAIDGVTIRITDGEIEISGKTIAPNCLDPDGWHRSGDLGELDAKGFLKVIGRKDNLIISGGENVSPEEVELALEQLPQVASAAVFGRPDSDWGQSVTAIVVANGSQDSADIREQLREQLASYKIPKQILFVDELPTLPSGKLDRSRLIQAP